MGVIVLRGLRLVVKGLALDSPLGLILFIPDALWITDEVALHVFGKHLCLERKAGNAMHALWRAVFGGPIDQNEAWRRLQQVAKCPVMCPVRPPPTLKFEAIADNLILFTHDGQLYSCGVLEIPQKPVSDACGPIEQDPQLALWVLPGQFEAYRPNLPPKLAASIAADLHSNAKEEPNLRKYRDRQLHHWFWIVAQLCGAKVSM